VFFFFFFKENRYLRRLLLYPHNVLPIDGNDAITQVVKNLDSVTLVGM